ncbi:P-loop containing nucleoside triphosphate hydrolase protein [Dichotomocladium elegans]|nr:P-loop containing nucleoside triphosphate hydrolase protein [Dichotomocladium elegans]
MKEKSSFSTSIGSDSTCQDSIDEKRATSVLSRQSANGDDAKVRKKTYVPLYTLFRFATPLELVMVVFASIGSISVGVASIASTILFGNLLQSASSVDAFLDAVFDLVKINIYLAIGITVVSYISHAFWVISSENQARRIKQLYVHAILRQDMEWFDKAEEGSLTTRLATDVQAIQDGISEKLDMTLEMAAEMISGMVTAFAVAWQLAVVIVGVVPVIILTGALMGVLCIKFAAASQDIYAHAGGIAEQALYGIRTVSAFSVQSHFTSRYEKALDRACAQNSRQAVILGCLIGSLTFLFCANYGLGFWYGSKLVREGVVMANQVVTAFFAMLIGTRSLQQLAMGVTAVARACAAANSVFGLIDRVAAINIDDETGIKTPLEGAVEFKNVSFSYPTRPDVPILNDFSLKISPGTTVALVGPSGSGKSTTVQLLQRFYDPIKGSLLIDGRPLKEFNVQWLRSQMGVVGQEPVLFNMTIRKNLMMGATRHVSKEELIEACKAAHCHDFIEQLPKKYDTHVGECGGMLSGGQKQRIAIARAILKNPAILLLDEATSALDTHAERLVQKALDSVSKNRTTIIVAHRLSTIQKADLIVVLDKGNIVEKGTHNDLIDRNGVYADLVRKQAIDLCEQQQQQSQSTGLTEDKFIHQDNCENDTMPALQRTTTVISSAYSGIDNELHEVRIQRERKDRFHRAKNPFFRIFVEMHSEWGLLVVGTFGAFLSGAVFPLLGLFIGRLLGILFDSKLIAEDRPMMGVNLYAFLLIILALAGLIGSFCLKAGFQVAGERYTKRLRSRLFTALTRQEMGFYDREENSLGALTTMLATDAKHVNEMVSAVLGELMQMLSNAIIGSVIAFTSSWELTLVILAFIPVMVAAAAYKTRIQTGVVGDSAKASLQAGEVTSEAIKAIRTVTSLCKQSYFEDKYAAALEYPHRLALRNAYLGSLGQALGKGVSQFATATAFYAGAHFMVSGRFGFQDMATVLMTCFVVANTLGKGTSCLSNMARAKYAALSVFELLERQPKIDMDLEGTEPEMIKGDISFEQVAFAYPRRPDQKIFDGQFDLQIDAGQTVAIVGGSGSGKSTIIGMLQRWYDPDRGTVRLDATNARDYTLRNLRSHMALVGQEPVLFDVSIGENVRLGALDTKAVTQKDVEEACKAANIHNFISGLPQGYDTRVGDKGAQLSGGQKQRIAIARALIRRPRILLLDEATSALDSESEQLVQEALDNVLQEGGRTTITIAHRLSSIQDADVICVIQEGRVIEKGTHQELLLLNGTYKALVQEQSLSAI